MTLAVFDYVLCRPFDYVCWPFGDLSRGCVMLVTLAVFDMLCAMLDYVRPFGDLSRA